MGLGQVGGPTVALGYCHPGVDVSLMALLKGEGQERAVSGEIAGQVLVDARLSAGVERGEAHELIVG